MTETSTAENEELVSRIYSRALAQRAEGQALDPATLMVYHVEMLCQEVNSGASFEQYFRWASVAEIAEAAQRLESLALPDVAQIVRRAVDVAFPGGLPSSDDDKDALAEWTAEQEQELTALADEFAELNGRITNVLAAFCRDRDAGA